MHLVSWFTCNTGVIANVISDPPLSCVKIAVIKSSIIKSTIIKIPSSINQLVSQKRGKSHQVEVWWLQTLCLKICGSHFTCKVANNCLNVLEMGQVVEKNKDGPLPFPAFL